MRGGEELRSGRTAGAVRRSGLAFLTVGGAWRAHPIQSEVRGIALGARGLGGEDGGGRALSAVGGGSRTLLTGGVALAAGVEEGEEMGGARSETGVAMKNGSGTEGVAGRTGVRGAGSAGRLTGSALALLQEIARPARRAL